MFVIVNGCQHALTEPQTLAELLSWLSPLTPFAVARNEEFVPAASYQECRICPGGRIEIVPNGRRLKCAIIKKINSRFTDAASRVACYWGTARYESPVMVAHHL
jgi:thiamine biosynthesis protein ThiS